MNYLITYNTKHSPGDPRGALKLVEGVLKEFPESPRALHSLARIYRTLYNNLRNYRIYQTIQF